MHICRARFILLTNTKKYFNTQLETRCLPNSATNLAKPSDKTHTTYSPICANPFETALGGLCNSMGFGFFFFIDIEGSFGFVSY